MEFYPDPAGIVTPVRSSARSSIPFDSDENCFPKEADQRTAATFDCYRCSKPAVGANFQEFFSYPSGKTAGVVQFSCGCDGTSSFGIGASTVFPQWRIVAETATGTFKVVKRTKPEREELISGDTTR